jgi:SAM-dependent methyltransferase
MGTIDPVTYPLAWDTSYERKGPQWRGAARLERYLGELDLSERALELGVGNGNTASQALKALGDELVCVDVSRTALRTLPRSMTNAAKVSVALADARRTPFQEGTFSAILVRHVLTHAVEGDEALILAEVRRALRPGGRALIEVFAPGDMRFGTGTRLSEAAFVRGDTEFREGERLSGATFVHGDGLVWRFYDEAELRASVEGAGLRVLRCEAVSRKVRHAGRTYPRESLVAIAERR